MLAHIWFGFFAAAFISALYQWLVNGQAAIFTEIMQSTFDMAALSVEVAIGLIGVLCLWLGFFRIAEQSGLINVLSRALEPLFVRLMPGVPRGHAAHGSITMNIAANMLGLDNAATPMGLKAMQDLQQLNPDKDSASNAQILFLVLNTSSVTLLPVTIFMYRAQQGAADPTAVFIPILMATAASTLAGLIAVAWVQRIRLFDRVMLASDRSIRVLRNLQSLFNFGRLAGSGYLSILPVDQGVEHTAGASFARSTHENIGTDGTADPGSTAQGARAGPLS